MTFYVQYPIRGLAGAPAPLLSRLWWRLQKAFDSARGDVSMALTRRSVTHFFCAACGAPHSARPVHSEYDVDGHYFGDLCEACVTELGIREWPCSHCSSLSDGEWSRFVHEVVLADEPQSLWRLGDWPAVPPALRAWTP